MKNKNGKIRLGTIILILISIILLGVSVAEYYFFRERYKNITNNGEDDMKAIIPTSDLVTLYYEVNDERANIFYAYIEEGYLYYFNDYVQADGVLEGAFDFISSFITSSNNKESMKKNTKLNNVKRIKTYNVGSSVDPMTFLITENGEVYTVDIYNIEGINVEKYNDLNNYKVEDILSCEGEMYSEFKILLKDGTICQFKK